MAVVAVLRLGSIERTFPTASAENRVLKPLGPCIVGTWGVREGFVKTELLGPDMVYCRYIEVYLRHLMVRHRYMTAYLKYIISCFRYFLTYSYSYIYIYNNIYIYIYIYIYTHMYQLLNEVFSNHFKRDPATDCLSKWSPIERHLVVNLNLSMPKPKHPLTLKPYGFRHFRARGNLGLQLNITAWLER